MSKKLPILVIFLILFPIFAIYAQEETLAEDVTETEEIASKPLNKKPDFWIGLGGDTALYSSSGISYGGSLAFGYGSGSSIGFKAAYLFNIESFNIVEFDLLLRFYLFGKGVYWGPFIQLIGGASLVNYHGGFEIPSSTGIINAGLSFGWRFIFIDRFFIEPVVRGGYPYFVGLGASVGVRF